MGFRKMLDSFDDTFLDPLFGAEEAPTSIDVSEIGPGAAGRNFAGDIASESFSATGAAPQFTGRTGTSTNGGPMTWTTPSITSSNPADLYTGGDSMFQNFGNQRSAFPGFMDAMQLGNTQAGPGPSWGVGAGPVTGWGGQSGGGQMGGMPGFGAAVTGAAQGAGEWIWDAAKGAMSWVGENPEGAAALGGLAANVYGAYQAGEIADDEAAREQEDRERQRELSRVLTPYIGRVMQRGRR